MKILFICTGNICRSPAADAIMKHRLNKLNIKNIYVDSAGTHGYHAGEKPDPRTLAEGKKRNIPFKNIVSRQVCYNDFEQFDLILTMDRGHYLTLQSQQPQNSKANLQLLLKYVDFNNLDEVSDPYYGIDNGFITMFDILEEAIDKLLEKIPINQKN